MTSETVAISKPSRLSRFLAFKSLLVTFSMVGMFATNVASLVSDVAHNWMHNAIWNVLSIGSPDVANRALANGPRSKLDEKVRLRTADLEASNKRLVAANDIQAKELQAANLKSRKLAEQMDLNGKQAKATVSKVHKRLAKSVSRNLAALPGEAIPYLGMGVALAVTSLDIHDACETMKDFNDLLRIMDQGEENPDLCGQKVPTVDEVLASAKSGWRTSVQLIAEESKSFNITAPDVRLPSRSEMIKASCAAVSVPYLCAGK